jgi:phage antirepressor YoqD-like protein
MDEEKKFYSFEDLVWVLISNGFWLDGDVVVVSRLLEWMHGNGWLIDTPERANQPSGEAFANGLFAIRTTSYIEDDGSYTKEYETLLTEKGEDYFENLFLGA